jgi:hypothetical protein
MSMDEAIRDGIHEYITQSGPGEKLPCLPGSTQPDGPAKPLVYSRAVVFDPTVGIVDDMPILYESEAKERPSKPIRDWLTEEVEVSRQKLAKWIGVWIVVCAIAGWIIWKLYP